MSTLQSRNLLENLTGIGTVLPPSKLILNRVLESDSSFCANCETERHLISPVSSFEAFLGLQGRQTSGEDYIAVTVQQKVAARPKSGARPNAG